MTRARRAMFLVIGAAAIAAVGGCEVVAIVSAVEDDGYPPPTVYLEACPFNLSATSTPSDAGGVYQEVTLYPEGLPTNALIAEDENVALLFSSPTGDPRDSASAARATGAWNVTKAWPCFVYSRQLVVELDATGTGPASIEAALGASDFGSFDFEVATPARLILSYEAGSRFRATLLDDQNRELFADASIEWEASPGGFAPGTDARGMFAPPIAGAAPDVTLYVYRGALSGSMRLKYASGFYVPAD